MEEHESQAIDADAMAMDFGASPPRAGFSNGFRAAFGHALLMMLRRQRLVLAAVVTLLPVLIPLAMAFMSSSQFADDGAKTFVGLVESVHINVLAPLLALFFACMLVGEDAETQTISYILTRPISRAAWVVGRFGAYFVVSAGILLMSMFLTFAACTALDEFGFTQPDLVLMLHYLGVAAMALLAYGAVSIFLGAVTKRPIIVGVLLLYGWQKLTRVVPGLIDFLTIQKYTDALLPSLATQRDNVEIQTALGAFQRKVFLVGAAKAGATLVMITLVLLLLTVLTVRLRQYSAARAAGS